jgi:hypothetical protein
MKWRIIMGSMLLLGLIHPYLGLMVGVVLIAFWPPPKPEPEPAPPSTPQEPMVPDIKIINVHDSVVYKSELRP